MLQLVYKKMLPRMIDMEMESMLKMVVFPASHPTRPVRGYLNTKMHLKSQLYCTICHEASEDQSDQLFSRVALPSTASSSNDPSICTCGG